MPADRHNGRVVRFHPGAVAGLGAAAGGYAVSEGAKYAWRKGVEAWRRYREEAKKAPPTPRKERSTGGGKHSGKKHHGTQTHRSGVKSGRTGGPSVTVEHGTGDGRMYAVKKVKPVKLSKMLTHGICNIYKTASSTNATNHCQFLGHTTFSGLLFLTQLCRAIVKAMGIKANMCPQNFAENVPDGTHFYVFYNTKQTNGQANASWSLACSGTSWEALAQSLYTNLSSVGLESWALVSGQVQYRITGDTVETGVTLINLRGARVLIETTSELKVQNRSLENASGAEATGEDVDHVPLVGRCYWGKGSGTNSMLEGSNTVTETLIANDLTGVIAANAGPATMYSPPLPYAFPQVKLTGGVKISAGEIKTNYMKTSYDKLLDDVIPRINQNDIGLNANPRITMGEFWFMAVERQIEGTAQNIRLEYEVTQSYSVAFLPSLQYYTCATST